MLDANLPGKPFLVLSLENSTFFAWVSFGYSVVEIYQVLRAMVFELSWNFKHSFDLLLFFKVHLKILKDKLSPSGSLAGVLAPGGPRHIGTCRRPW